jgi:Family of unknown function (DUF6157)
MNMKQHTTNYKNTFIEVAEDSLISEAKIPPQKKEKTIANLQYEIILENPYKYTSDDIIFECYSIKNDITEREKPAERQNFFSKGQPCLRCSPLAKTYGFGIHHNNEGKVAVYPLESEDYQKFLKDDTVTKVKAMRSKRK